MVRLLGFAGEPAHDPTCFEVLGLLESLYVFSGILDKRDAFDARVRMPGERERERQREREIKSS